MTNFVSVENSDEYKNKNLFIVARMYGFVWLVFHFTIVYFFWLILDSILLVWLFLWFWNLIALLADIPVWVIQKYFEAKKLLIYASIWMVIVSLIFAKFIFLSWIWWFSSPFFDSNGWTISNIVIFLDSWFNWFLFFITAFLYWIIKELFDVTFLSYVLNSSPISKYAENISKYNISFWTWAFVWIILSWIILWLVIKWAIFIVFVLILLFIYIIIKFFDRTENILDFSKIKDLNITSVNWWIDESKRYIINTIKTIDIKKIISKDKPVFLVPLDIRKKININEIIDTTFDNFKSMIKVLFELPRNLIILWSMNIVLFFSFWDTFVATFQVEFLNKIVRFNSENPLISETGGFITWYVLLWILIIPIFFSQQFFINKSKTIWIFKVMSFWMLLSSISIFLFWFSQNLIFIMFFWLINSFWYAAVMPLAMATFSEKYNIEYSKKYNLKEIDSNISAVPLKVVMNIANILWLVIWWILVTLLWFDGFFKVLWIFLWVFLFISVLKKDKIIKN